MERAKVKTWGEDSRIGVTREKLAAKKAGGWLGDSNRRRRKIDPTHKGEDQPQEIVEKEENDVKNHKIVVDEPEWQRETCG